MTTVRLIISIVLLSWIGTSLAAAEDDRGRGLRNDARAIQFEQNAERRERARGERETRRDERVRNSVASEHAETVPDNGQSRSDESRRASRLNPDERRALRRQIHEVGHDIYTPPR